MKRFWIVLCVLLLAVSCKEGRRKALLPNVSGKAGEIVVVMEKADWEGAPGAEVRTLLASDCPFLPQREPLYSLINVTPGGFADLFKVHRNIVFFDINPQATRTGVSYLHDVWASPQCVVNVCAADRDGAVELLRSEGRTIVSAVEQAERDRVIRNTLLYEEKDLAVIVRQMFGGALHFPTGYKLMKRSEDFIWIADEKQYTTQGVFVYRVPAEDEPFTVEKIVARRNAVLKAQVPGAFDNTWMTTSRILTPGVEYLKYRGRSFAETRGLWEVENDYMGGPFVSHSFYSPDGQSIIVCEAFVYAPKFDKRQYLRQVESLLYSWEWGSPEESEKK